MTKEQAEPDERMRLWQAVKLDFFAALEAEEDGKVNEVTQRMYENWDKLCELDLKLAAYAHHNLRVAVLAMANRGEPNSPLDYALRHIDDSLNLAGTEIQTLGAAIRKSTTSDNEDRRGPRR
jgi:hypothetical protein